MPVPISKLAEIDPAFREVVNALYPALDPRQLWDIAKANDASEVHVNGNDNGSSAKKKALAGGLLLGTAAEGTAVYRAGQHAFKAPKAPKTTMPGQGSLFELPKARTLKDTFREMKAAHGPKAEFGMQAVNAAIGLGAAKELFSSGKPKQPKQQTTLAKADFLAAVEPVLASRRRGEITTEQALSIIGDIEKSIGQSVKQSLKDGAKFDAMLIRRGARRTLGHGHQSRALRAVPPVHEEQFRSGVNASIHRGRKMIGGVALGTAVAGGTVAGVHAARRKDAEDGIAKADQSDYEFSGEISKVNEDKKQVFGWCSLSSVDGRPVVDLQNDYISIDEIEKSAYDYVKNSRKGGDMHARVGDAPLHVADMIESVIVTPDKLRRMGVPEESISKVNTGWWVGFQVNDDDVWAKVKSGERSGFSIHGKGQRLEKMLDD